MSVKPSVTCENCTHCCDGQSLNTYEKDEDAKRSEKVEAEIIDLINFQSHGHLVCRKSAAPGQSHTEPDIEIRLAGQPDVIARLEVKYQRRAFMSVKRSLPNAGLAPLGNCCFQS